LLDDELSAHDIITDLVHNDSKVVKTLYRRDQQQNDQEQEYVNVMRFGKGRRWVYWIEHQARDVELASRNRSHQPSERTAPDWYEKLEQRREVLARGSYFRRSKQ
jgi:hypothetical protein